MNWISVETTLRPKEGEEVLITDGNNVAIAKYDSLGLSWTLSKQLHATHWTAVPDLPTQETELPIVDGVEGFIIDSETNGHISVMVALNTVKYQAFYSKDDAVKWLSDRMIELSDLFQGKD